VIIAMTERDGGFQRIRGVTNDYATPRYVLV